MLSVYWQDTVLAGYRIFKTDSAAECLDKLNQLDYKVDVVLVNGTIAADKCPMLIANIKKSDPKIRIFALAENENDKTRVLDYRADEFAVIPVSPTTTLEKVGALLMKEPSEAEV